MVAGGLVAAAGAMAARPGHVFAFDANLFRLVNLLPGAFGQPLLAVMELGALAAVPAAAVVALAARRPRLASDLGLSGGLAWLLAKLVKGLVGQARPVTLLYGVVERGLNSGLGYPSGHAAVAAARAEGRSCLRATTACRPGTAAPRARSWRTRLRCRRARSAPRSRAGR